ncbi:protein-cysteine N-palmitoyltransferase Rasp [Battus philenor]|uniref:protein-cysteine N-palmitoyltransferase Rasp n=1 Tax=Battus philenor TaxID=42288 RepID=UPI0035CFC819
MRSKLNPVEIFTCLCVWVGANLFSLFKLFEAQTDLLKDDNGVTNSLKDLQPGWSFIGRQRDVSDIEWSSWKYFIHTSLVYMIMQFFISELIRKLSLPVLKYWYIISSTIFIIFHMGVRQMVLILFQPILYGTIIFLGGSKKIIWIISLFLLASYNSLKYKLFFWNFLEHEEMQDEEVYLILFSVAWIELRCISYSIDFIQKRDDAKTQSFFCWNDIINMLSYTLYLPLLYSGPIILYEEFEKSFNVTNGNLALRLKRFVSDLFVFKLYTFILDIAFHYFYFFAMQDNMQLMYKLPTTALCGGGLWMGLEFHMKYVISYGTTTAFARIDNIEPPPIPRCIARVHIYSQMWRHFDVGLYRFLVKYIYKPGLIIISQSIKLPNIGYKLIASLATFVFIFMWHGTVWHIFIWSILNYLGIILEHVGKELSKHEIYDWFKTNILKTDKMEACLIALLCTPLLALSAISNFYLFAGAEVGNLFFESFMNPSLCNSILLGLSLYCCCHVSMALADVPSRGSIQKIVKKIV